MKLAVAVLPAIAAPDTEPTRLAMLGLVKAPECSMETERPAQRLRATKRRDRPAGHPARLALKRAAAR